MIGRGGPGCKTAAEVGDVDVHGTGGSVGNLGFVITLLLPLAGCVQPPGAPGTSPAGTTQAAGAPTTYIGVMLVDVDVDPALGAGSTSGSRIDFVLPGGPADTSGLREGDTILSINGKPGMSDAEVTKIIRAAHAGDVLATAVLRGGQRLSLDVKPGIPPPNYFTANGPIAQGVATRREAEQGAAVATEHAGDSRAAFDHYVSATRFLLLPAYRTFIMSTEADQVWMDNVGHLGEIVPRLQPRPAVPSEADRHNRRGVAILHNASSDDDNDHAITEFWDAVYEAPWIPDLYLNLALTQAKAGYVEAAIQTFHRYLLLNPNDRDAASIKQKIAELEVLADERKPWLPFITTWPLTPQSLYALRLRGRAFSFVTVKPDPAKPYRYGDAVCSGTIHGQSFAGQCQVSAKDDDAQKCFGPVFGEDARGTITGNTLTIEVLGRNYTIATCVITSQAWMNFVTLTVTH